MSSTGTITSRSSCLAAPASTIVTGRGRPVAVLAAEEAGDLRQRPLGGREADALQLAAVLGDHALQPLQAERQVRAALGAGDGVDLVDDHRADAAEDVPPARGQQQVEALGRGDEDVGRRRAASAGARAGACRRCGRRPTPRAPRAPRARPPRRCRRAARAGCARRRSSAPSGARGRAPRPVWRPASRSATRPLRAQRKAASVLPEPVGARMRLLLPRGDRRPAALLGRRGGREGADEPLPHERVEGREGGALRDGGRAHRSMVAGGDTRPACKNRPECPTPSSPGGLPARATPGPASSRTSPRTRRSPSARSSDRS